MTVKTLISVLLAWNIWAELALALAVGAAIGLLATPRVADWFEARATNHRDHKERL